MFADDTKLYSIINNQNDAINLQENLDRFSTWCHQHLLPVNINKCNAIYFTKKKYPLVFNYKINNIIINRVDSVRNLGVLFPVICLLLLILTYLLIKHLKCLVLY